MPAMRVASDMKDRNVQFRLAVVVGPLGDLRPHDGVGAAPGRLLVGLEAGSGDPGRDRLDLEGPALVDPEVPEAIDEDVGSLAGDVGHDDVAHRAHRRAAQDGQRAHGARVGEHGGDLVGQRARDGDRQSQHAGQSAARLTRWRARRDSDI